MTRLLVFLLLIFFSSCLSLKPAATKSKSSIIETFFVGDEGLQYFIKPMYFQSRLKNKCYLDLTFRHKTKIEGKATANISIQGDSQLKSINRVIISNSTDKIILDEIDFMFIKDFLISGCSIIKSAFPFVDLFLLLFPCFLSFA